MPVTSSRLATEKRLYRPRELGHKLFLRLPRLWAVVVAQLLPIPEIRGSNPNIGKVLYTKKRLPRLRANLGSFVG